MTATRGIPHSLLHPITGLPLRPVGLRRDGRPILPILGGSTPPPPAGGSGSGDASGSGSGSGATGAGSGSGGGSGNDSGSDDDADPGDDDDADPGDDVAKLREALRRERAEKRAEKTRAKTLESERDNLKAQTQTAEEKALNDAKKSGAEETEAKYRPLLVAAGVRALAAGKLADPADAVVHLDLSSIELDDTGSVDPKAVGGLIDGLLAAKPYLAGTAAKRTPPPGAGDQGHRTPAENVTPGVGRLGAAYASRSK